MSSMSFTIRTLPVAAVAEEADGFWTCPNSC
jgi:hypothetical protein